MSLTLYDALSSLDRKRRLLVFLGAFLDGLEAKSVFLNDQSLNREHVVLDYLTKIPFQVRVCILLTYLRRYNEPERQ